jgi:hypothetical protein
MERTVKVEIQALRDFPAIQEILVFRDLLVLQDRMVRMAHRELVELREVQEHLGRLVLQVIIISDFYCFPFLFSDVFQLLKNLKIRRDPRSHGTYRMDGISWTGRNGWSTRAPP